MPAPLKTAAVALASIGLVTATATSAAMTTIRLHAYVPVYCNVELIPTGVAQTGEGIVELGFAQEFCNAPRGYRVILEHTADVPEAAVISDTVRIPLSGDGETVLSNSDHPDVELRHLALDLGENPEALQHLGLRIEVKY